MPMLWRGFQVPQWLQSAPLKSRRRYQSGAREPNGLDYSLQPSGPVATQVRRIHNWKSGEGMSLRWAATFLLGDEQRFHRIKGHAAMVLMSNALARADLKAKIV